MPANRTAGHLRGPEPDQVAIYAERLRLGLGSERIEWIAETIAAGLERFDRLDEMPAPPVPLKHTDRDPGRPPAAGEDRLNAVIRHCRVRGAEEGTLAGRTVGVKDCIAVAGVPTTNGGRRVPTLVPTEDAVVVERLLDAGATITMKTNMEDLATGLGEWSQFGPTLNPVEPRFSPGGSSSGSGAAVAAGLVDLALGTDQGGSVRIPAAWCGLVGMKATHGLVPSHGITHMDPTIDHVGPLTRTVADSALVLEAIAGGDWRDPAGARRELPAGRYVETTRGEVGGMRVGAIAEALEPIGSCAEVLEAFAESEVRLRELGVVVERVSVPLWTEAFTILQTSLPFMLQATFASGGQGAGHLGRIDVEAMAAMTAQARSGAGDLPIGILLGLLTAEHLRSAYSGVHFGRSQNLRLELERQVSAALGGFDLLITPTTPTMPFELRQGKLSDEEIVARSEFLGAHNTAPLDLTGHPAISVPCGRGKHGLPIGLQMVGRHFDEAAVYRLAAAFERAVGGPDG
ncbi:MAG TPA: amidase family protein [Solirubrobacterales bacterium]|nr:amidase family protein [Solirubrobacterales bacterium]